MDRDPLAAKKPLLSAHNLRKVFYAPHKIEILRGISLEVELGSSVAIMGTSGEGKSTLLHILGTLDSPTKGDLAIVGKSTKEYSSAVLRNRHIGFIFQSFHLLEDYTVLQNVLMPACIGGRDIREGSPAWKRALHLIDRVGLKKRRHFYTKFLSGGEKQRVALARAFCNDPELILADEPSGNLDQNTSKQIHQLLVEAVQEEQKGLIVVTHDKKLAALCDRVLTLEGGVLQ